MRTNLNDYRASEREQSRIHDLFALMPEKGGRALDIGARDGYLSRLLTERFGQVVALDIEKPDINHPSIESVKGNVCHLDFEDESFDLVVCAEVLEHIPPPTLPAACHEISRVARQAVVIGVPYKQDLRCGRSTCRSCGQTNPAWGHVNAFDEIRLQELFGSLGLTRTSFAGQNKDLTNALSVALMDFAGNPFGTYTQEETCVHCGANLVQPSRRSPLQRGASRLAFIVNGLQRAFTPPRANWLHARFEKHASGVTADNAKPSPSQIAAQCEGGSDALK